MIGVIILAVVVVIVLAAFLLRSKRPSTPSPSRWVVPERVECERCGMVRITTQEKRTFIFSDEKDRTACRVLGQHAWLELP